MPVVRVASPKGGAGKTTLADLEITVLLADAMCLALLPRLRRGDFALENGALENRSRHPPPIEYVFNQIEPQRRLCCDVLGVAHEVLGATLFGSVHHDEAVAEAAACQMTVFDYAPESVAAHDIAPLPTASTTA